MSLNLAKLAAEGRAYSPGRCWTSEELEAVLLIERERGLSRKKAADFVRNGVDSLEAFDKATKKEFVPKTLEEATAEAETSLKSRGEKVIKSVKKATKGKK